MDCQIHTGPLTQLKADAIVIGITPTGFKCSSADWIDKQSKGYLSRWLKTRKNIGEKGEIYTLYDLPNIPFSEVYLIEMPKLLITVRNFEDVLQKMYLALSPKLSQWINTLCEWDVENQDLAWKMMTSIYWADEINYQTPTFKTQPPKKMSLSKLILTLPTKNEKNLLVQVKQMQAQGNAMRFSKDLANLPANICTPTFLAQQAKALGKKHKSLHVSVIDENMMHKEGMGLILSVSQGSSEPAQLITIEYHGGPKKMAPIALIGKGVTFDTGGISLKPRDGMDEMKYDMCGAATILGLMQAAAELKWPINLIGVAVAVENFPAYEATKPGDIIRSLSGKTVEILNADAEGRLILADALTYIKRFSPQMVINVATLTGAIVAALGNYACGIFSEDEEMIDALQQAGEITHDRAWRMPMWHECDEELKTPFADLANISFTNSAQARSIVAARFLAQFVDGYRWAHLDIAGVAWRSGRNKSATGRPIPLLMNFFCEQLPKLL